MTLKTKISAAAIAYHDKQVENAELNSRHMDTLDMAFEAGSKFTLGEVRELLREVRGALTEIQDRCPVEVYRNFARAALEKIDDSGVI